MGMNILAESESNEMDNRKLKFAELRRQLSGDLIFPGEEGYEAARQVYNAMVDRRPALIVRCTGPDDVIAAVNFARVHHLEVAVRGGGHSVAGYGTCDGGMVIDLSGMKVITIDPAERTAYVEGGCTWGELDRAAHLYGLATPGGVISTTGVAGLTLGGGFGHLTRKYGLAIDNLLEVELVLADGSLVRASAEENEDLFWAVRGGGGNFGIATTFRFRLHLVSQVYGGPMLWPIEQAVEVMSFYRDFLAQAEEELSGFFVFLVIPPAPPFPEHLHLKNVCGVVWCYSGPATSAEAVFQSIHERLSPAIDFTGPLPYPELQSMFDLAAPPGMQQYWRADFFSDLTDDAISLHAKYGAKVPTLLSTTHIYPLGGAVHRFTAESTAFSYRDVRWAEVIIGADPDPANKEKISSWVKDYWQALHPYSAGGAYVNFLMDEGQERIRTTYRENYARLAEIKRKYDPNNFFHINQNIPPAAESAVTG